MHITKKTILNIIILISVLTLPILCFAGSVSLRTYYQAPKASFDRIRFVPRAPIVGPTCTIGTLYVDSTSNKLNYCEDGLTFNNSLGSVGNWDENANNIFTIDPATENYISQEVGIRTNFKMAEALKVNGNVHVSNELRSANDITANIIYTDYGVLSAGLLESKTNMSAQQDISSQMDITATAYFYTSDRKLKNKIRPINKPLKKIRELKGVSFKWKKSNKPSIGLIAQDVEKTLPELVATNNQGKKSIQYANIAALLTEGIKEQQNKIIKLKNRIKIINKEIELLRKQK